MARDAAAEVDGDDDDGDDARESVVIAEQVLCALSAVKSGARNVHWEDFFPPLVQQPFY